MSVQFGIWNFDDTPVEPDCLEKVCTALTPYAPDGMGFDSRHGVSVHYYAFHCTGDSRGEMQPYVTHSGAVVMWDGRLDNRSELIFSLDKSVDQSAPDVTIVAAA